MTSTAGPGRARRWTAGLAWALWLANLLLCLAVVPWLDELLRQAGRAGRAVDVIAVVLAARSAPPIRPPPTLVSCQCGRPASR